MYYTYMGQTPGNPGKITYKITLVLYKDTTVTGPTVAQLGYTMYFSIFRGDNQQLVQNQTAVMVKYEYMNLTTYNPCLTQKPPVKYAVATYEASFDVDTLAAGYYATNSQCCRIAGVLNMNSTQVGASYWVKIPGLSENIYAPNNSSAIFNKKDTILVCKSSPLSLDFSATDPDGDQLRYRFTNGYIGAASGPTQAQITPVTANTPPYSSVSYSNPYTSQQPLGAGVVIDSTTGKVTGIAPDITGIYLITVLVEEYRNGFKISEHRKEFQVKVEDCTLTGAQLKPSYITCNGTTLSFTNESTNSNIIGYLWDFGVPGISTDTSSNPTPTFDYLSSGKDSGSYTVKLKVTATGGCQDSASAPVSVYPGFQPDFTVSGSCYINTYQFKDATTSKYGSVNSWRWNFGDNTTLADTARSQDSAWKYPAPTTASVQLIVTNTKGCLDTITKKISISDQPSLNLAFHDTLICSIDTLTLKANYNSGVINWVPSTGPNSSRILGSTTNSPQVYPQDTTRYIVTVNDNGCINSDTVTVNVLPFISVDAGPDTGICRTDFIQLQPTSQALSYRWTDSLNNLIATVKNPKVQPLSTTRFYVTANLGKCQANDSVLIRVAPYPKSQLGADTTICFGSRFQLQGNIVGTSFYWQPTSSLINENTLTPIAGPDKTTAYILFVTDTIGCPKPSSDTLLVTVIPPLQVHAGNDTTVAANQPVQLQASGATNYDWSPATFLNNPFLENPIATPDNSLDSIRYRVQGNTGGCYGTDYVTLHILHGQPDILVPTAFTPNGDGRNDVIRPVLIGITKLSYFSIYNRWGQLLFTTAEPNKGWDGYFNGIAQPPGTYVYQTLGTDYQGKIIFRKGTVVLIR